MDSWNEWKVLPTEEVEDDGLTDKVSTMGKEDKCMRTVLRACVHEMEKVDFTIARQDSQNNQLIFPFKYCSFVVVWFDFALAFAFVLLLPVASEVSDMGSILELSVPCSCRELLYIHVPLAKGLMFSYCFMVISFSLSLPEPLLKF